MWRVCAVAATAAALQAPLNKRPSTKVDVSTLEAPTERVVVPEDGSPMRPPILTPWDENKLILEEQLGFSQERLATYDDVTADDLSDAYEMMQLCRQFENACAQSYMQGSIRGFMHLDNGQETIPALVADTLTKKDIKYSYYREHTHALASGVSPNKIMAELFAKDGGTCRGTGGSMHIFDVETHFQGGWALVAEQFPYAAGAARSIMLDRHLGLAPEDDDRLAIVFCGEGGSQNGRLAEVMNCAAKEKLPLLILCIDNGRAINTFTPDVAQNSEVWKAGAHYGVPGAKVDGTNLQDVLRTGRAVVDYVRETSSPAILQVHTYRLQGHSPADPEHERGRKAEKKWARAEADPLKIFEATGALPQDVLDDRKKKASAVVKEAVAFAKESPPPPRELAKELEFPDPADTDYNTREVASDSAAITERSVDAAKLAECQERIAMLQQQAKDPGLNVGDALNLAILEEMVRDPRTTIHAEDLQAGSSYDIPRQTQQTFGELRAADEIIDEGHFIGKAIGEGMNGYRPIVELMNANFGIYGMAELSSAGNTYATTGGQFKMPLTVVGAGGTAPNQALGAEHSQPFHAYVMGIPGLKICTAATPEGAYGLCKAMIRDDGPGMLFTPVKLMKDEKVPVDVGTCLPLNKAHLMSKASDASVSSSKAVTVLTYLHGVREAVNAIPEIQAAGHDIDLIELRSLKPLDLETIQESLARTHKLCILDESTQSGGVGASISALVGEELFDELDAPVKRLCMDDAPVPYASSMEQAVVKRGSDLVIAVKELVDYV
jgi:TPP-dependent pyruvate/acetoin dehydrogenase alpha subunit/pyruvate/2-oxoglutarate/acetoin dehydrogenase E1 component